MLNEFCDSQVSDCQGMIEAAESGMENYSNLLDLNDKNQVAGISLGLTYNLVDNRMKLFSEFSQLSGETLNPYDPETETDNYNSFDDRLGFGFIPIGFTATMG